MNSSPSLRDLYQQVIIEHSKNPRNRRIVENANRIFEDRNSLCGDRVTIYVNEHNNIITDLGFQGEGCAILIAAASLMTEVVTGKTVAAALELFAAFHQIVTGSAEQSASASKAPIDSCEKSSAFSRLEAFTGVKEFPVRVKCAMLPWRALKAALTGEVGESNMAHDDQDMVCPLRGHKPDNEY